MANSPAGTKLGAASHARILAANVALLKRGQVIGVFRCVSRWRRQTAAGESAASWGCLALPTGAHQGKQLAQTNVESSSLYVRRDGKWLEIFC